MKKETAITLTMAEYDALNTLFGAMRISAGKLFLFIRQSSAEFGIGPEELTRNFTDIINRAVPNKAEGCECGQCVEYSVKVTLSTTEEAIEGNAKVN